MEDRGLTLSMATSNELAGKSIFLTSMTLHSKDSPLQRSAIISIALGEKSMLT